MDEKLQAQMDEARAAGYSDEEIQNFLASKDQPIPVEQPIDRSGEYGAVAQQMGASIGTGVLDTAAKAVEYGVPAALAYKAIKGTGPVAPTVSAAPQMAQPAQQATGTYGGKPNLSVQTGGAAPVAPQAPASPPSQITAAQSIIQKLALDKVLKGAGIAAGAYGMGQGLFGTSDEEVAVMRQAEARKRAQGWKPMNER